MKSVNSRAPTKRDILCEWGDDVYVLCQGEVRGTRRVKNIGLNSKVYFRFQQSYTAVKKIIEIIKPLFIFLAKLDFFSSLYCIICITLVI